MTETLEQRADEVLLKAQRANAYRLIQNTCAAHLYSYRAQAQYFEIENYWVKSRDDITYFGSKGRDSVVDFYCATNRKMRDAKLQLVNRFYPEIEVCEENDGMGDMVAKAATTPYIVVADDGQSAKALWFSPGICSEIGPDGKPKATYMQEKLALDLLKEEDGWKIFNLKTYMDFITPIPSQLFDAEYLGRTFDMFEEPPVPEDGEPHEMPEIYSVTTKARFNPPLPEPYETWENGMGFK